MTTTNENPELIIAPSILACDLTRLGESVRLAEQGGADWHHVDVMDGHFVPNLTFGPDIVMAVREACSKPIDVHLMLEEPQRHADAFLDAGANSLTFHIEVAPDPLPLIRRIRDKGGWPGLVIKPATPASAVFPFLDQIDMVLVMTVEPGFTGQAFMPDCVQKIAELRREAGPGLRIEVDGGVNERTIAETARAGANVIVAGAAVYRSDDIGGAISRIRNTLKQHYSAHP